jgi:hypothetical protein
MISAGAPETDVDGNSGVVPEVSRLQTILSNDNADGQKLRSMMDR